LIWPEKRPGVRGRYTAGSPRLVTAPLPPCARPSRRPSTAERARAERGKVPVGPRAVPGRAGSVGQPVSGLECGPGPRRESSCPAGLFLSGLRAGWRVSPRDGVRRDGTAWRTRTGRRCCTAAGSGNRSVFVFTFLLRRDKPAWPLSYIHTYMTYIGIHVCTLHTQVYNSHTSPEFTPFSHDFRIRPTVTSI